MSRKPSCVCEERWVFWLLCAAVTMHIVGVVGSALCGGAS